jgi:hypothetical protein
MPRAEKANPARESAENSVPDAWPRGDASGRVAAPVPRLWQPKFRADLPSGSYWPGVDGTAAPEAMTGNPPADQERVGERTSPPQL